MPIVLAPLNAELTIIKVLANPEVKKHLESLGIVLNGKIKVLSNAGSNLICQIKDARVALDTETASKIFVAWIYDRSKYAKKIKWI